MDGPLPIANKRGTHTAHTGDTLDYEIAPTSGSRNIAANVTSRLAILVANQPCVQSRRLNAPPYLDLSLLIVRVAESDRTRSAAELLRSPVYSPVIGSSATCRTASHSRRETRATHRDGAPAAAGMNAHGTIDAAGSLERSVRPSG